MLRDTKPQMAGARRVLDEGRGRGVLTNIPACDAMIGVDYGDPLLHPRSIPILFLDIGSMDSRLNRIAPIAVESTDPSSSNHVALNST